MKKETFVKCDVTNCKHNDHKCCCLEVLDISCTCQGCDCNNKKETICSSFSEKNNDEN